MGETGDEPPRKRGRPAKPASEKAAAKKPAAPTTGGKKGRGRPKGSKNKPRKVTSKGTKRSKAVKAAAEEDAE